MSCWQWGVVSLSAVVGALIRLGISRSCAGLLVGFPSGTMIVNLVGCFLIGLVWTVLDKFAAQEWIKLAVITGALGSLTTFSTFALDALKLIQSGQVLTALVYSLGSVVIGVGLVAIGAYVGSMLLQ